MSEPVIFPPHYVGIALNILTHLNKENVSDTWKLQSLGQFTSGSGDYADIQPVIDVLVKEGLIAQCDAEGAPLSQPFVRLLEASGNTSTTAGNLSYRITDAGRAAITAYNDTKEEYHLLTAAQKEDIARTVLEGVGKGSITNGETAAEYVQEQYPDMFMKNDKSIARETINGLITSRHLQGNESRLYLTETGRDYLASLVSGTPSGSVTLLPDEKNRAL